MNNLRAFLQLQGLSARDIDDAVREARQATRVVHTASGALVEVFTRAAHRVEGERTKKALAVGAKVAQRIHDDLSTMLAKR